MSPFASAVVTSVSGTSLPRFTRSSNGLFASSFGCCADSCISGTSACSMEGAFDDVHLLLAREAHEVHGVARDADRQARVLLRMLHRVHQRLPVQHVHV